uniref:XK-related protein n=1 Tax=Biomphalaria glabrata TaxID=6526 RepID=A0A2C9M842_BIOGL
MAKYYFTLIDIAVLFVSLITLILSICTDILICVQFMLDGQMLWSWLMVGFISLPSVLMNSFSLAWHVHDKTITPTVIFFHLLLIAPIHRYLKGILYGINSLKTRKVTLTQKALKEQSDATILRLFESFLECAPQLVLQCYIALYQRSVVWFVGISAACSLISLTWSMTSYTDSQRRVHPTKSGRRTIRLFLHWAWQLFVTASRIGALVFFAGTVHYWIFALIGCHWMIAFIWLSVMGTDFGTGPWEKWLFRLVCGFIYIFVFLNVNEGPSRWRITTYYVIVFLENTAMVVVFLVTGNGAEMVIPVSMIVFVAFFLGLMFMILYYDFLRRTGHKGHMKRFPSTNQRASVISGSSIETGSQVFSVESPSPVTVMQETVIDIDHDLTNSHNATSSSHHGRLSPVNSRYSGSESNRSQLSLQKVWQSGMISSSSSTSSSSLLSMVESINSGVHSPSIKSSRSHNSSSTLLPSRLPSADSNAPLQNLQENLLESLHSVATDSQLYKSVSNKSPTLSRSSWARSSDLNRHSMVIEDFTVLGFDDSSSTDRKTSDSSSFSNQPKSLSPLNVSILWKDIHSRLRATIAATIAEATGNASSTESSPNKNHSISFAEDSLNSTRKTWNISHNNAFMESVSSFKEESSKQSMDSSRREALVSLPDIVEALDLISEISSPDKTFVNLLDCSVKSIHSQHEQSSLKTESSLHQSNGSKLNTSSYPEDSTLTLSKLGMKESTSFNKMQKQELLSSNLSPMKSPDHSEFFPLQRIGEDGSPFTDKELVHVMASSLQSYIGASSSYDSNAREGLALTLDDLQFDGETSPTQSAGMLKKSRSASSLFHDSTESSPASSASKMNQALSIQMSEKFSPNALKIIDIPSISNHTGSNSSRPKNESVPPHSLALRFIMDAYGSGTPVSNRSHHLSKSNSVCASLSCTPNEQRLSNRSDAPNWEGSSKFDVLHRSQNRQPLQVHELNRLDLPKSLSNRRSKSSYNVNDPSMKTRGAVSSTKKLSVHFSPSPTKEVKLVSRPQKKLSLVDSDSEVNYVAGHYWPPLCTEGDKEVHQKSLPIFSPHAIPSNYKSNRPSNMFANKSLSNLEYYFPKVTKTSQQNITHLPSHTHKMENLTDDELRTSARHVASYFSEALDTRQESRPIKHFSQPNLRVHHPRQPLQPLHNSPHFSPEYIQSNRSRIESLHGRQLATQNELSKSPRKVKHVSHSSHPDRLIVKPPLKHLPGNQ